MPRKNNRVEDKFFRHTNKKIPMAELYVREGGKCCICKQDVDLEEATREHLVPKSRGGRNGADFNNIGLSHEACNKNRRSYPIWEETLAS